MMRFVLVFLLFVSPVHACLWSHHTTLDGKRTTTESMESPTMVDLINARAQVRDQAFWEEERQKYAAGADLPSRNDHAVALLHLGQTAQAIEILEAIERERPGEYFTAANLGTAYELAGRNEDALQWIREGIKRNPQSHSGTEWLHVAILEAKVARATDSVLGLDFGLDARPRMPKRLPNGNDGKPVTAEKLRNALTYQLMERRQFVNPPAPYVADLYFDWGNLAALTTSLEEAVQLYDEALRFGVPREELAKKRRAHMKSVIGNATVRKR